MALVLVVEDHESFSDALSYRLRKEGFEVAVCPTAAEALDTFDRVGADLVLLDLMLPGTSGTEVCQSLRERSDVPLITMSARDTELDKAVMLQLGADDYLPKPFTWRDLAERIRAVLPGPGDESQIVAV
jgi:two-component system, OmpR family, response regulator RegX3